LKRVVPLVCGLLMCVFSACQDTLPLTQELSGVCPAESAGPPQQLDVASHEIALTVAHTPSVGANGPHNTHCVVSPWLSANPQWIRSVDLVTDQPGQLVRVNLYLAASNEVADVFSGQDIGQGNGFPCVSPLVDGRLKYLGVATPDVGGILGPADSAVFVPEASSIVAQLVYRTDSTPLAESSTLKFHTLETEPTQRLTSTAVFNPMWLLDGAMRVPGGGTPITRGFFWDLAGDRGLDAVTLRGLTLEMGPWATGGRVGLLMPDGSLSCLLEVSEWNGEALRDIYFAEEQTLQAGERLYVECTWSNDSGTARSWGDGGEVCRAHAHLLEAHDGI
jgi:hypothetical protein